MSGFSSRLLWEAKLKEPWRQGFPNGNWQNSLKHFSPKHWGQSALLSSFKLKLQCMLACFLLLTQVWSTFYALEQSKGIASTLYVLEHFNIFGIHSLIFLSLCTFCAEINLIWGHAKKQCLSLQLPLLVIAGNFKDSG